MKRKDVASPDPTAHYGHSSSPRGHCRFSKFGLSQRVPSSTINVLNGTAWRTVTAVVTVINVLDGTAFGVDYRMRKLLRHGQVQDLSDIFHNANCQEKTCGKRS